MRFPAANGRLGLPRLSPSATAGLALFGVIVIFVTALATVVVFLPTSQVATRPEKPHGDAVIGDGERGAGVASQTRTDVPLRAAAGVPALVVPTPVDIAVLHATAEARSGRSPTDRQSASSAPPPTAAVPGRAPPPKPGVEKPVAAIPGKPIATAGTPTPTVFIPATPTRPPTRTVTPTFTPTATLTPTLTPTHTPPPSPCTTAVTVPGLSAGYGYVTTIAQETVGHLAMQWPGAGGSIMLYSGRPAAFGDVNNGVIGGVPADMPLKQGSSGPGGIRVPDQPAGQFTFYFFNGSPYGSRPSTASISYWTYGHCP
ncbi:MAG: hypothetical protein EPO26_14245 [Chloroflexota bacterium]|nr:MAG: hypothetical protein EPO26_14245 [Chloroflexota bacterium]